MSTEAVLKGENVSASDGFEQQIQELKREVALTKLCIRYALVSDDPRLKQWLLWQIAIALDLDDLLEIGVDFGEAPPSFHSFYKEQKRGEALVLSSVPSIDRQDT